MTQSRSQNQEICKAGEDSPAVTNVLYRKGSISESHIASCNFFFISYNLKQLLSLFHDFHKLGTFKEYVFVIL